jgi:putative salt-induced outer membrane protein
MTTTTKIILSAAAATLLSTAAFAQVTTNSAVDDRLETLNESIAEDFERDVTQFGNEGRALGYTGSLALQTSATSGNSDTSSIGVGANVGYYDGTNGYELQFSYTRSENEGVVDDDSLLYELQYTRDLTPSVFGFGKLQGSIDSADLGGFDTSDNYLGLGLGYRVYDTAKVQWTVQAGLGYRTADLDGLSDFDEPAISLSSGYYNQVTDTFAVTMDTDIIGSDSYTVVYNDLGVNVSMTDTLALRTSLVTEYHTDPAAGRDDTDNNFGVSLVYNFD